MPNLETFQKNNFPKSPEKLINARRNEIFYRDDIKSLFEVR